MPDSAPASSQRIIVTLRTGLALAAANVVCAAILAWAWMAIRTEKQTVRVTGSATQRIQSDLIVWKGTLSARAADLPAAYAELKAAADKARAFYAARGIAEAEMPISAVSLETHYERDAKGRTTDKISGYTLRQTITVTSRDVLRVEALSRAATELIEQGVLFDSHPAEFFYTRLADLKIEMLARATQDAANRAGQLCTHSGSRLGALHTASMGVMQITAANSTEVSDYGVNDTSSYEKDVRATVSASFLVEK